MCVRERDKERKRPRERETQRERPREREGERETERERERERDDDSRRIKERWLKDNNCFFFLVFFSLITFFKILFSSARIN